MCILVTGGTGYIGSHAVLELLEEGFEVVIIDNLSNSSVSSIGRVQDITGRSAEFIKGDIRDLDTLRSIFEKFNIEAVIHFAGLKAVGESVDDPVRYYENNVVGAVSLLKVMLEFSCKTLIFSSSATVYGDPVNLPLDESSPVSSASPYGTTKLVVENLLREISESDDGWSIAILRYFNPVGAHESGLIGESPTGTPNNLMPYVAQVAAGMKGSLKVFGDDYPTLDGSGVRDYIHVVDLAKGHLCALKELQSTKGVLTVNLGTGRGYSVFEVIAAFEEVSGRTIAFSIDKRRSGDVASCYADPSYAKQIFGWVAQHGLTRMCKDTWRWQCMNPNGYSEGS